MAGQTHTKHRDDRDPSPPAQHLYRATPCNVDFAAGGQLYRLYQGLRFNPQAWERSCATRSAMTV